MPTVNAKKKRKPWWKRPRTWRWLQLVTGVHYVHHIRYGFGWTAPFSSTLVRFDARGGDARSDMPAKPAQWLRVSPAQYHDCTRTGTY